MVRLSRCSMALLLWGSSMAYADEPQSPPLGVEVKPIASLDVNSAGQPIIFPQTNGHVTASMYDIPPGESLPVHEHPFPRMGYVLSGTLRVTNTESGVSKDYEAGAFVLESVGIWHKGENPGRDNLKLLVIDLIEKGAATTLIKQSQP